MSSAERTRSAEELPDPQALAISNDSHPRAAPDEGQAQQDATGANSRRNRPNSCGTAERFHQTMENWLPEKPSGSRRRRNPLPDANHSLALIGNVRIMRHDHNGLALLVQGKKQLEHAVAVLRVE